MSNSKGHEGQTNKKICNSDFNMALGLLKLLPKTIYNLSVENNNN